MKLHVVGIDLGKTVFHLVGLDSTGKVVIRKKCSRTQLLAFTANLQVQLIGMESCSGSHFLGRALREQGHEVRLMPAQYEPAFLGTSTPWDGATSVIGTGLSFGANTEGNLDSTIARAQLIENLTWIKGNHTLKFGGGLEHNHWNWQFPSNVPFSASLFNPTQAAGAGIPVPATYNTIADVLQLPLSSITIGIGNG